MAQNEKDLILLVEDEPENLSVLQSILLAKGFRVEGAANGLIALEFVRAHLKENQISEICTIVSDFDMPQMDGIQLLNEVKKLGLSSTAFILMSGKLDKSQAREYVQLGVDGILFKPFSVETMMFEIEESYFRRLKRELRDQGSESS